VEIAKHLRRNLQVRSLKFIPPRLAAVPSRFGSAHTDTFSAEAKPKSGMRFAVVLLSHGWEGTRSEYTSVAEDLASHGYAVFGVDHPYMGRIALPIGEVTEPTERQFHCPAEIVAYYARDLEFVIARIGEMNREDPDQLFVGKFDH
jgi:alpha-beta hydrolase superfamily lysophospholipase